MSRYSRYVYLLSSEIVYGDDPDTMVIEDGVSIYYENRDLTYKSALKRVLKAYINGTKYVKDYLMCGRPKVTFVKFKSPWVIDRFEVTTIDSYGDITCHRFFINKIRCFDRVV